MGCGASAPYEEPPRPRPPMPVVPKPSPHAKAGGEGMPGSPRARNQGYAGPPGHSRQGAELDVDTRGRSSAEKSSPAFGAPAKCAPRALTPSPLDPAPRPGRPQPLQAAHWRALQGGLQARKDAGHRRCEIPFACSYPPLARTTLYRVCPRFHQASQWFALGSTDIRARSLLSR